MRNISYSQNREDVVLWRALRGVSSGFYIDVGANDPVQDSVTKLFYDAGWHGINIEPLSGCYQRLQELRERDVNIQALAGREKSVCVLHEFPEEGRYSTVDELIAKRHEQTLGMRYIKHDLPVLTLTTVCEQYAPQDIHFLKIDVEGHEAEVLRGFNLTRFRPWILLIEATEPNSSEDSSSQWESLVINSGYVFACFDGLSKFYVAREKQHLVSTLQIPANIFDDYVTAREASLEATVKKTESVKWIAARLFQLLRERLMSALDNVCAVFRGRSKA